MGTLDASRKPSGSWAALLRDMAAALRSRSDLLEELARKIEITNEGDLIRYSDQKAVSIIDFAETNENESWQDSMDNRQD